MYFVYLTKHVQSTVHTLRLLIVVSGHCSVCAGPLDAAGERGDHPLCGPTVHTTRTAAEGTDGHATTYM